jgi:hypothetical protein
MMNILNKLEPGYTRKYHYMIDKSGEGGGKEEE